jgi:hypothetical protein
MKVRLSKNDSSRILQRSDTWSIRCGLGFCQSQTTTSCGHPSRIVVVFKQYGNTKEGACRVSGGKSIVKRVRHMQCIRIESDDGVRTIVQGFNPSNESGNDISAC